MPEPHLYNVHLYAVVRRKLTDISAESPQAAVHAAQEQPTIARWLRQLEDPQSIGEFAEEFNHYLVDVAGDEDFEQSCLFHAAETPLLQPLRDLVRWDDSGRDPDELRKLLKEARHILSQSL